MNHLTWTLKEETEQRSCISQLYSPQQGCRAGSFRPSSQTSASGANTAADNRNRLPSIVQTSIKQEKRLRLLQWILQMCADSRGKLHREIKRQHILTCVVTEVLSDVPTGTSCYLCAHPSPPGSGSFGQQHPDGALKCPLPNVKSKKRRTLKCQPSEHSNARTPERRESKAEMMYGRLRNIHITYQRMSIVCIGE